MSNITETCGPENELQLITQCNVEANITDDQNLLKDDVENLVPRMELDELLSDGGYTSG